ncbi:ABC transporter substrate-binding protein [Actinoplanes sp. NPDC051851]|uniref:ABC transporter substrate-binding protein n=1 Tax=Actinoplanes sp. NPDC051851 TaxID=3154753 RepID=UPI003425F3BE
MKRRTILTAGAATLVAGCGRGLQETPATTDRTIRIGYLIPKTGNLAVFGESNDYVLGVIRNALRDGLTVGGSRYTVEILDRDTQSSGTRAAQVAGELIGRDGVDIVLATSTPDTTNPVSDQCEAAKVPCLATICPWEIWYYPRGGKDFTYTYLYFIGTQAESQVFARLWQRVPGGPHTVGALWPGDVDGDTYRKYFTPVVRGLGWTLVDPGAYQDGLTDFTPLITKLRDADILQAAPIPPDFITFWKQADQNRFRPRLATVAKALLFPSAVEALGRLGDNLVAPAWWHADYPFASSLDGMTARAFADGYQQSSGRQWTQPMGMDHAIFEIAVAALKASGDPKDRQAVAAAIGGLKGEAITGKYDFSGGPVKNVALAPDLVGQWRLGAAGKFDLVVVDNSAAPEIPVQGELQFLR